MKLKPVKSNQYKVSYEKIKSQIDSSHVNDVEQQIFIKVHRMSYTPITLEIISHLRGRTWG